MGLIRFAVHPPDLLAEWPEVQRGYLSGADGRVFPTRIEPEGAIVGFRRSSSESSKLHVAWPVPGHGRPVLQTTSLPERDEPYLLPVELARGELVQVRNQSAAWEQAGMQLPPDLAQLIREAYQTFSRAASSQPSPDVACRLATESLQATCRASDLLCLGFTRQALAGRQQRYPHLPASLGCELGRPLTDEQSELFCAAFNAVTIPVRWTHIETSEGSYDWETADQLAAWAESQRLILSGGPLVDLGPGGLPEWLAHWEHDIFNLQSFVCDFVETAIARYIGRIRQWEIAARFNTGGALTLSEESRLSLVVRVLEVARQVDEEAQLWLRVDQPWGEYQARGQHRLSPLQAVDALLRSGVSLAGINLEIAIGYQPRGTPYRDLLDFSRLIDTYSVLGVPLHVTLAAPSSVGPDPLAMPDLEIDAHGWPHGCDETQQALWLERCLPLLMAKPAVAGVTWGGFSDAHPHEFPRSGLMHADGIPKPALERLIDYRQSQGRRG
jgi:GH35 family endo-1,4-beta-xylanase